MYKHQVWYIILYFCISIFYISIENCFLNQESPYLDNSTVEEKTKLEGQLHTVARFGRI